MLVTSQRCSTLFVRALYSGTRVAAPLHRSASNAYSIAWRQSRLRPVTIRALHQTSRWQQVAAAASPPAAEAEVVRQVGADGSHSGGAADSALASGPITRFRELEDRKLVHPNVVRTLTQEMSLDVMTDVQSKTINEALKGVDMIAQAKTGTGKTIAFLLPIVQNILSQDPALAKRHRWAKASVTDTRVIIVSPTRELAEQIAQEARKLVQNTGLVVQTAVGGTQKRYHLQQMRKHGCHILVGTPGRLNDILGDAYEGIRVPKLSAFILDEADRLLDSGFWPEIQNIQCALPDPNDTPRQTLMFSATIPKEVVRLVRETLRPGFHFIKCVRDDEEPTHHRVPQRYVKAEGLENLLPTLVELCLRELESASNEKPFKALVYFNSTADTDLALEVFENLRSSRSRASSFRPAHLYAIHGKLTQAQRTRATEQFRKSTSAIMLSSDVTARGMDFPNVTHVIQMGVPQDRDTYIHRIGRTGRAGKEGEGWLIVADFENHQVRARLRDMPLRRDSSLHAPKIDMSQAAEIPATIANILNDVIAAHKAVDRHALVKSYLAGIGLWKHLGPDGIGALNRLSRLLWGLEEPPIVSSRLAQKLGLARVVGLNIRDDQSRARQHGKYRSDDDPFGESRSTQRYGSRSRPSNQNPFEDDPFGDFDSPSYSSRPQRGRDDFNRYGRRDNRARRYGSYGARKTSPGREREDPF